MIKILIACLMIWTSIGLFALYWNWEAFKLSDPNKKQIAFFFICCGPGAWIILIGCMIAATVGCIFLSIYQKLE